MSEQWDRELSLARIELKAELLADPCPVLSCLYCPDGALRAEALSALADAGWTELEYFEALLLLAESRDVAP